MLRETAWKWQFVHQVFRLLAPFSEREWPLEARYHIL